MVILKKAKLVPTQTTFQHLTTEPLLEITPVSRVLQSVHVIHDCKGGKCTIKEGSVSSRVEQEQQNVKCKFIKHSTVHNIFIINKCRISHSVDKFVIWKLLLCLLLNSLLHTCCQINLCSHYYSSDLSVC